MKFDLLEEYMTEWSHTTYHFPNIQSSRRSIGAPNHFGEGQLFIESSKSYKENFPISKGDSLNTQEIDHFIGSEENDSYCLISDSNSNLWKRMVGNFEEEMEHEASDESRNIWPASRCIAKKEFLTEKIMNEFNLKKTENIRQTVVRRYKKNIRKIVCHTKLSQENIAKSIRSIKKSYALKRQHQKKFEEIFTLMISIVVENDIDDKDFDANFTGKSCNNTYISELFSNPGYKELFECHLELGRLGDMYKRKFTQLKKLELTEKSKRLITEYSLSIMA